MRELGQTPWTLVLQAARGSVTSRDEFSRRYRPLITGLLAARWRLSSAHEDVVEATQQVFLVLFSRSGPLEKLDRGRGRRFRSYLYGVVWRVAATIERGKRPTEPLDPEGVDDFVESTNEVLDRVWAKHVVREALDLTARRAGGDAQVLRLRYERNLRPSEIAEATSRAVRDVYRALRRSRREFRAALVEVVSCYDEHAGHDEVLEQCRELLSLLSRS